MSQTELREVVEWLPAKDAPEGVRVLVAHELDPSSLNAGKYFQTTGIRKGAEWVCTAGFVCTDGMFRFDPTHYRLPAPPTTSAIDAWASMNTAPRDGTEIQARIPANGENNVIAWQEDAFLNDQEHSCGGWAFTRDQEPPDCWTDGICWAVNEDGNPSVQPTAWKHLPTTSAIDLEE